MLKRKKLVWFVMLACISCLGSIGWARPPASGLEPLRIGLMPDVNSLVYLIAEKEGIFDEMEVDVKLVKFQSASLRDTALHAGEIDGAVSDLLAVFFALGGGLEVRVTSVTEGRYALVVPSGSGITQPTHLEGKQIAVSKNTIIEYAVDRMLHEAGVNLRRVKKVSIPQVPVRLQMVMVGKVDAACLPDPLATVVEANGGTALLDSQGVSISPSVMVFRLDSLEKHRDSWKKVAAAYDAAVKVINERENSSWFYAYDEMGFPRSTWDLIKLPVYRFIHPPTREEFESVLIWMQERGLVRQHYSYGDIVDLSWIEEKE